MKKIEDEVNKTKNEGAKKIGEYLLTRDDLKEKLENPKKSLEECFLYCASKYIKNAYSAGKCKVNGDTDEAIYAYAVHYYDEDDIKVDLSDLKNVKVQSKNVETKDVKKDVPKPKKEKKEKINDNQLTLDDFLGL